MKRFLALFMAFLLLILAVSCSGEEAGTSTSDKKVKEVELPVGKEKYCAAIVSVKCDAQLMLFVDAAYTVLEMIPENDNAFSIKESIQYEFYSSDLVLENLIKRCSEYGFCPEKTVVDIEVCMILNGPCSEDDITLYAGELETYLKGAGNLPVPFKVHIGDPVRNILTATDICPDCMGSGIFQCAICQNTHYMPCVDCHGVLTDTCDTCNGTGKSPNPCTICGGTAQCQKCDGTKHVTCPKCTPETKEKCKNCKGTGYVDCTACGATGKCILHFKDHTEVCKGFPICPVCKETGDVPCACTKTERPGRSWCCYCEGFSGNVCPTCGGSGKLQQK